MRPDESAFKDGRALFRHKLLNGWYLFGLVSLPVSAMVIAEMVSVDMSSGEGVSHMIGYAVRFAIPLIFVVIAASAMQRLFPGPLTNWWLRNRKYLGLSFAVAMAWQGLFIFIMSNWYRNYYYSDIYLLRDEIEGSVGYIFLAAMVVTSFRFGRKHLTAKQWKFLHTSGVYFLWAYPFSVYWWNLSYYEDPQLFDHLLYWVGFLAVVVRIAAWGKQRVRVVNSATAAESTPTALRNLGAAIIVGGLFAAATGVYWQAATTAFLTGREWSANLELWLPFWPFEPFLPLFAIGIGTMLATTTVRSEASLTRVI